MSLVEQYVLGEKTQTDLATQLTLRDTGLDARVTRVGDLQATTVAAAQVPAFVRWVCTVYGIAVYDAKGKPWTA